MKAGSAPLTAQQSFSLDAERAAEIEYDIRYDERERVLVALERWASLEEHQGLDLLDLLRKLSQESSQTEPRHYLLWREVVGEEGP